MTGGRLVRRERIGTVPLKFTGIHRFTRAGFPAATDAVGRFGAPSLRAIGLQRSPMVLDDPLHLTPGGFVFVLQE